MPTKKPLLLLLALALTATVAWSQGAQDQRVLFSVEDTPVTVGEFVYIYSKTNGEQADFSRPSLEEYLDLYVKFKLKVRRAHDMQLDTIPTLMDELAGYRRQLADSYLIDRAIGDQLLQDAYAHAQQDYDISHILFALANDASPADTLAAYERAQAVLRRIQQGATFEAMAAEHSEDRYSKERGGRVGFVTALFPAGLHRLEYAAYAAPLNKVQGPIRTGAGYHLLRVNARRPARGEMEVAHILVRKEGRTPEAARTRIDSIYRALQQGAEFDQLARATSEDGRTASNGGYLGFFGINRYEVTFEDAAFALQTDDAYSAPVETAAGWHIIKRVSQKGIQPFAVEKARLDGNIRKDARFEEARLNLLARIKTQSNYRENTNVLNTYLASLPDTFVTFRWRAPETPSKEVLFTLGKDYRVTLGDFTNYLGASTRQRANYAREGNAEAAGRKLFADFVNDQLMKYEETQLEVKYPEFKALMREYEEGILLFEATKLEVWDRAAQDSVGLERYFTTIPGKYVWMPRGRLTTYRIGLTHQEEAPAIREYARTHTADEVRARFNTDEVVKVTAEEGLYEQNRSPILSKVMWQPGAVSDLEENNRSRSITFYKLEEIVPATPKTLAEARGYVIADYQDQLEREWVAQLRSQYQVQINQRVFDSLVK